MANHTVILSGRLPPGAPLGGEATAPRCPRITIIKGELLDFPSNFIVMSTDKTMALDLQISTMGRGFMKARHRWRNMAREGAPQGAPVLIDSYIGSYRPPRTGLNSIFNAGGFGLGEGLANITPPGLNPAHNAVVVVNIPKPTILPLPPVNSVEYRENPIIERYDPNSNRRLRRVVLRALQACRTASTGGNLPGWMNAGPPNWWPDLAYQGGKCSIAFNLIGSNKDVGYGFNNSAEQVLGAISSYFNIDTQQERDSRRNEFLDIYLLVSNQKCEQPKKIQQAWNTAWYRYVTPPAGALPPGAMTYTTAQNPDTPEMQVYAEAISGTRTLRSGVRGRK
ncbi:hypothetical protein BJ875DRAFT_479417 [Amylocarpus encephaloides]|uniref:Uncharacterized protein n=1 Tax=Amylocarpus encephaloides TaxID=45428 RepID=A0A9P7YTT4_9HELO|nr:hypothetical protein BJ875DRAFT_479417 [Amylocarpus encephaloides]